MAEQDRRIPSDIDGHEPLLDGSDETRTVAILLHEDALLLNVIGPTECFAMAGLAVSTRRSSAPYRVELLSVAGGWSRGRAASPWIPWR